MDHRRNSGVAHDGDGVETAERDGDPDVVSLKSWDASEDELKGSWCRVIHLRRT